MISDTKSLSGVNLDQLFDNIDDAIKHTGSVWRYKIRGPYRNSADRFDKFFTEKLNDYSRKLGGKQSVIAQKSVFEIVAPHKGNKFILKLDIKKYYESISYEIVKVHMVRAKFDEEFIKHIRLFYFDQSGFLRRGLRGSAIISELVGLMMDKEVSKLLYGQKIKNVTYSRFYDDLLFSSNSKDDLKEVENKIVDPIKSKGLLINSDKAKLMRVENSKILGLRIFKGKILVTKKFKKILRVREHRLSQLLYHIDWGDVDQIRDLKKYAGHVIGSLWYVINNSESDISKYKDKVAEYKVILSDCDNALSLNEEKDEQIFYDNYL